MHECEQDLAAEVIYFATYESKAVLNTSCFMFAVCSLIDCSKAAILSCKDKI